MSQSCSIQCGLPFFSKAEYKQTNASIALRVTAIAVGTLAVIAGTLMLAGVPVISQLGTTAGWAILSSGLAITLVAASIRCARKKISPLQPKLIDESTVITRPKSLTQLSPWLQKYAPSNIKCIDAEYYELDEYAELIEKEGPSRQFIYTDHNQVGFLLRLCVQKVGSRESPQSILFLSRRGNSNNWERRIFTWEGSKWKEECESSAIFGQKCYFKCDFSTFDLEDEARLLETENLDDLADLVQEKEIIHPWFLMRLLSGKNVVLRESKILEHSRVPDFHQFHEEAIGYWKISLEQ